MNFENISRLGPILLGEKCSDLQLALKSLCQIISIPDSYQRILLEFAGPVIFENGAKFRCDKPCPLGDKDGYLSLELLYGLGNTENCIERAVSQYASELLASFTPVGESSGGNLICIAGDGAVYLWDHESLRDEGLWQIAVSIDDFLIRLEPDDSEIGSTEGIIKSKSYLDF